MKGRRKTEQQKKKTKMNIKKTIAKKKTQPIHEQKKQVHDKYYNMNKIINWIQSQTNIDFRLSRTLTQEQTEIRNQELFPLIKEKFLYSF